MYKPTHTSRARILWDFPERYHYTHTQVAVYWRVGWWWYTPIPMPTLDYLRRHIFLLHVYRSVSLARIRRCMQLAYLFHQCAKSLLSGDSSIVDCTVRHQGVEHPFSSIIYLFKGLMKPKIYTFWFWAVSICDFFIIKWNLNNNFCSLIVFLRLTSVFWSRTYIVNTFSGDLHLRFLKNLFFQDIFLLILPFSIDLYTGRAKLFRKSVSFSLSKPIFKLCIRNTKNVQQSSKKYFFYFWISDVRSF